MSQTPWSHLIGPFTSPGQARCALQNPTGGWPFCPITACPHLSPAAPVGLPADASQAVRSCLLQLICILVGLVGTTCAAARWASL